MVIEGRETAPSSLKMPNESDLRGIEMRIASALGCGECG